MTEPAPAPDLEPLEAEIRGRLEDLEARRAAASLKALADDAAEESLRDIETSIDRERLNLERLDLARVERQRLEDVARQERRREQREAALAEARSHEKARRQAAVEVDRLAKRWATALRKWDLASTAEEQALKRAGWSSDQALGARPRNWQIEASVRWAMRQAACPDAMLRLGAFEGVHHIAQSFVKSLAELDQRVLDVEDE